MHPWIILLWVIFAAMLVGGTVATIRANLSLMTMVDEMNVLLPPEKRISVIGLDPFKLVYVFTNYSVLCPDGQTQTKTLRRGGAAVALWVVFMLLLGLCAQFPS